MFEAVGFGAIMTWLNVRVLVRHVCVLCIALEPEEIVFAVCHAIEEDGSDAGEEGMEVWDEVDIFSKCKPELAGFESDLLILVFLWNRACILRRLPFLA